MQLSNSNNIRVAVLMTCHNRREKTLACLDALFAQDALPNVSMSVYLVDDGSSDDTGGAVLEKYPDVNVLRGNGSLFWCGGMRLAWQEALKANYAYYLWLNDDTFINKDALSIMLESSNLVLEKNVKDGIVVGSVCDPYTGKQAYGGHRRIGKSLGFELIEPQGEPVRCDTMNGNCVLVPKAVVTILGNLSEKYTHALADIDYGLRANMKGIANWIAPGYIGECSRNALPEWSNPKVPLRKRLEILYSPKGLPPSEWAALARRHVGFRWPLYWLKLLGRAVFPGIYNNLKGRKT